MVEIAARHISRENASFIVVLNVSCESGCGGTIDIQVIQVEHTLGARADDAHV